jgi:hypothetical protein
MTVVHEPHRLIGANAMAPGQPLLHGEKLLYFGRGT